LLQKVEILAVDQRTEAAVDNKVDANQLRSVTLKVTPLQAKQLNLGQSQGTLHLVLRSPTDDSEDTSRPATMLSLRYKQEKPWDERAKSVLLALGQALKERKPVEVAPEPAPVAAPPVPVTPPAPKLPPMIRTIRGTQEGATYVRPPAFSPPDR
jgi:Flp pilus assembly protein CpaB